MVKYRWEHPDYDEFVKYFPPASETGPIQALFVGGPWNGRLTSIPNMTALIPVMPIVTDYFAESPEVYPTGPPLQGKFLYRRCTPARTREFLAIFTPDGRPPREGKIQCWWEKNNPSNKYFLVCDD